MSKRKVFLEGLRDGVPIGLGYFAVAFSLGIIAKQAGLNAGQGFLASLVNSASAGEYALFSAMLVKATYIEVAIVTLIVNARYLLMSCALSQKFSPDTKLIHRLLVGFLVTDEFFGITIARPGYVNPIYNYGAIAFATPMWCIGTSLGIIAGSTLPANVVSALSVALYGMFIAIIVPPAKKNKTVMISVIVSFVLSYLCETVPYIKDLSGSIRTIILTLIIAGACAIINPVKEEENVEQ